MNQQSADTLRNLLDVHGLTWMIDAYHPADKVVQSLLDLLDRVAAEYHRRVGQTLSFNPQELQAEAKRNPHKIKAFLQALAISNSPEMLVMVWRILQGLTIREVTMEYREREGFFLDIGVSHRGDAEGVLEQYHSTDINDATLIRHFGIAAIRGEPLFEGFYPLRVKDDRDG